MVLIVMVFLSRPEFDCFSHRLVSRSRADFLLSSLHRIDNSQAANIFPTAPLRLKTCEIPNDSAPGFPAIPRMERGIVCFGPRCSRFFSSAGGHRQRRGNSPHQNRKACSWKIRVATLAFSGRGGIDAGQSLYHWAPMPFMQRLTWEGVALHGGYLPGRPASHGCIRLPHAFAKLLFQITSCGDQVVVTKTPAPSPPGPTGGKLPAGARPASADAAPHVAADTATKNGPKAADDAKTRPRKSMAELEGEEVGIRNNPTLTRAERQTELLRVWGEQRSLAGTH